MKWTNYHSHTNYSDGIAEPEMYALAAIEKQMYAYGFSCHSPVPIESDWNMKYEKLVDYINEINRLKEKYNFRLKIYLGLEIDYIKDRIGFNQFRNLNLDYSIGSVHFLGFLPDGSPWTFDHTKERFQKGLEQIFDSDIKKLINHYYQQVIEMVSTQKTDVLGHFDLIKKFNKDNAFFNENDKWYRDIVFAALDVVAKSGIIVEVNTRGVLKKLNAEFYPSNDILKHCLELKIPVCLSADTHDPKDVMAFLPEASDLLENLGFQEVIIFDEKGWNPVSLKL